MNFNNGLRKIRRTGRNYLDDLSGAKIHRLQRARNRLSTKVMQGSIIDYDKLDSLKKVDNLLDKAISKQKNARIGTGVAAGIGAGAAGTGIGLGIKHHREKRANVYMDAIEKVALTDEQKMEINNLKQQNKALKGEYNEKLKQLPGYKKYDRISKLTRGVASAYCIGNAARNIATNAPLSKTTKDNLAAMGMAFLGNSLTDDYYYDNVRPVKKSYTDKINQNRKKIREIKRMA